MRILRIIAGIVSIALAVLFCIPLAYLIWGTIYPDVLDNHVMLGFIISFTGSDWEFGLYGWQVWAFVSLLTLVAAAIALVGVNALRSKNLPSNAPAKTT
jgi:hypothetical protein